MKTAVCMKYVPVIARMRFDYEARTIIREGVPSEVNPFDVLGLVRAVELKSEPGDEVVVLTMGPPGAAEGLTSCLALGADRGVLVTDRAFAGSDTLATSRALALALGREQPDLIICGRNSTDGETGQVGPEVAELMGLPHVSSVRRLELSDDRRTAIVERITDEGFQTLECDLPAVVCVTEGVAPELFPNRQQMEEAATKPVNEVTCGQLSDDPSQFGAQGSPTWVNEIRLVEPNRLGVTLQEVTPEDAARQIADSVRERLAELISADASVTSGNSGETLPRYPGASERSIWVVAENTRDGLAHVTFEMLGKARELTATTRSEVVAVVIASGGDAHASTLAAAGADRVLVLDNSSLGPVCSRAVGNVLADAVGRETPYAILFASTADGRDLAARLAARLSLGLTGDAIDLEIDDEGQLVQLKPALGGNVVAPILSRTLPNLVTLRPGLLTPAVPEPDATATVERLPGEGFEGSDIRLVKEEFQEDTEGLDLARARVVVGLGMGAGEENVAGLVEMARSIGASVAITRDVVHAGWLPQQLQVGISGRTIAPTVYIAVGIRGAFNHTVGLQRAGIIVAINQNRRATIFRSADFGIVGTWQEFLAPLIEELRPCWPVWAEDERGNRGIMSVTERLAQHIADAKFDAMPTEAVEAAKMVILDGLAVTLAGSQEEAAQIVADYAREMGGNPQCSTFGHGFKTSPPMAAFINGVAGHVLDYEVMWHPATHATSPTLPGILALAESRQATGRDIVTALITGFEVQGRIRVASADLSLEGFHPPGLVGVMGSAAAGAVMLGLDTQQTRMALGMAASRAGTVSANTGTMTKSTHCGNAGRMGLEAALLASKGFTANASVFEHENGYAAVFFGEGFDLDAVVRDFGNPYRLVDPGVAIKKHPSQYGTHRGIDAALDLQKRFSIDPERIAAVRVETPVMRYVGRPFPETGLDGKFSFQYTVAASLLDRRIGIETFTDEAVHRPEVLDLLGKTTVDMKPEIPANFEDMWVTVSVETTNGQTYRSHCARPRGIWGNPLSREERLAKVRSCASRVLGDEETQRLIEVVEDLEAADSSVVQELVAMLGREPAG